ncbi:uncharacterized protein K489DRAFT_410806 [Dissoconium aciculare CBS 342.82]|uniref:Uncharacterized protein n=1 Tax=Dissoconium aciculare CBS 342.82 TaxID=1314786 RepID=A0A6J3M3P9_9PEZI|nr:uncharacterized protein K489DRAFT_410806 [Dissoconium aciculare CBS 342.82]KAF1822528.1 hypothetical protein K489DRAFT_410806 [Dissoconium aciculare CBS 342.82]
MSSEGLFDDKFRVAVLIVRFIALPVLACCMLGSLWLLKSWKVYDVSHRVWFNVAVTTTFLYLVFANCLWFTSPESTRLPTRSVPIFATFTGLFYFVPRLMTFVAITCFAATFTSVLSHRRRYKTFNEWASGLLFGLLFLDIVVRAMDVNNSIHYDTSKGSRWITYSGRSGLLADISRVLEVLLLAAYLLAVLVVVCSSFRTSTVMAIPNCTTLHIGIRDTRPGLDIMGHNASYGAFAPLGQY